ncbi:MAG: hypothetical protein HFE63_10775 [Clostridiales bacterium]|nr:hypothetical protein [Clostridiales bacterium]
MKRLAMCLGVIILTFYMSIGVAAVGFATDDILAKIDELASKRAGYSSSEEVQPLLDELDEIGVVADSDILTQLKLSKPVKVDGVQISDFAGFAAAFEGMFDYFIVMHEQDGREVCELIIQDIPPCSVLRSTVYQNGSLGYNIHSKYAGKEPKIADKINEHLEVVIKGMGSELEAISTAGLIFPFISNIIIPDYEVETTGYGTSRSYVIDCFIESSIHLLYTKTAGEWKLAGMTNTAEVAERHSWYYTYSAGKGQIDSVSGSREYRHSLKPDDYDNRIALALDGNPLDTVKSYTAFVPLEGGGESEAFKLDIFAPTDTSKLVRRAAGKDTFDPVVIDVMISAVVSVIILSAVFILTRKHRKKA